MITTNEELAYWAGVIDSDGWIIMTKRKCNYGSYPLIYGMQVGIGQVTPLLPKLAHEFFNKGYIIEHTNNGKPFYSWVASSNMAYEVLRDITIYLKLKKEQARLCMEYREKLTDHRGGVLGKSYPITDEEFEFRSNYYKMVRELNGKKGVV